MRALIMAMSTLAFFTLAVMVWAVCDRRMARSRGTIGNGPTRAMTVQQGLVELPVLFYVACLIAIITRQVIPVFISLSWGFVGLRIVHAAIQLTYDKPAHRIAAFAASSIFLTTLWLAVLVDALHAYV